MGSLSEKQCLYFMMIMRLFEMIWNTHQKKTVSLYWDTVILQR